VSSTRFASEFEISINILKLSILTVSDEDLNPVTTSAILPPLGLTLSAKP
jgi:hypothetical protein